MKLKYCLQGFGVGILFATIILSISFMLRTDNSAMTDEEVIARARILGMEMATEKNTETNVAEAQTETTTAEKQTESMAETVTTENTTTESVESETATSETSEIETNLAVLELPTEKITEAVVPETTTAEQTTEAPAPETTAEQPTEQSTTVSTPMIEAETKAISEIIDDEKVVIQVPSGVNSDVVARMLEEAGVVDNAKKLDNYMVELGVSRYVRTGTYQLRKNMTYDEIVNIMCK